jgi:hypothetical protein
MTPKKLRDKYTTDVFKNVKELETFYHKGGHLNYDFIVVDKILFTLHEYDMDGQNMNFYNKKHDIKIDIETSNRYGELGFTDAKVYQFNNYGAWRNDIVYAE